MLENPWAGLEQDFEEVREELTENAEELVQTIPMSISNWMRKRPSKVVDCHLNAASVKSETNKSIARLADTITQFENQLESEENSCASLAITIKTEASSSESLSIQDASNSGVVSGDETCQELMQPSDFEMESQSSSCPETAEQNADLGVETVDRVEAANVSIDNSSPLLPQVFDRKSLTTADVVQSPPCLSSQPATPDRLVKPQPVVPTQETT